MTHPAPTSAAAVSRMLSENGLRAAVASRSLTVTVQQGFPTVSTAPGARTETLTSAEGTLRRLGYHLTRISPLAIRVTGRDTPKIEGTSRPVGPTYTSSVSRMLRRNGWHVPVASRDGAVHVDIDAARAADLARLLRREGYDFTPAPRGGGGLSMRIVARTAVRRR